MLHVNARSSQSIRRRVLLVLLAAFVCLLTVPASARAAASEEPAMKPVQVFDVKAGKVVRTIPNDAEYQQFAGGWLKSVTGLSPKVRPDEKCGFVYRVPLQKPYPLQVDKLSFSVSDVFLFYCTGTEPILLVFDEARRPYLLNIKADLKPFLRKIAAP
jgi:hypothetical protein